MPTSEAIDAMLRITPPPWRQHDAGPRRGAQRNTPWTLTAVQPIEILGRRLLDRADVGDAGVVDEDVDPGVGRPHAVEHGVDVGRIRDVALMGAAASAVGRERFDGRAGFGLVEIERDHLSLTPREQRAMAAPMPEPAPVTMATFRCRDRTSLRAGTMS